MRNMSSETRHEFIRTCHNILNGRTKEESDIPSLNGVQDIATGLLGAFNEDGEKGFWDAFNFAAKDNPDIEECRKHIEECERPYQMHRLPYMKNQPRKAWGVYQLVYDRGSAAFVGDAGCGKSTFVLNLCLSRVFKKQFVGRDVKPGVLVWVAAEGVDEIYPRVAAWLGCNGIEEEDFPTLLFIDETVPFNNTAEIETFIESVKEQLTEIDVNYESEELIFAFDTYARCTPGANENDTQEAKLISDTIAEVCKAFNAQVNFIHHANARGDIRGSTVFKAGVDTAWIVTKDGDLMTLECKKMRGHRTPDTFTVEMRSIILDEANPDETAPVIFPPASSHQGALLGKAKLQVLEVLSEAGTLSSNEWSRQCMTLLKITYNTWLSYKKELEQAGYVTAPKETPQGKKKLYSVTPSGAELLS